MVLPESAAGCIAALENAGYPCYAVGGCVRDACLGLTPHDYDLCTAALPQTIRQVFADRQLVLAGEKHGTVGVVTEDGVIEITTFRTEGGYQDSRHPDWVRFVDRIEDDLARRDFTVNAMAYSPTRGFADPFGGREDLKKHILRAVGDPSTRFEEDALRILRGVRFAVRFGLTVEENTMAAMVSTAPLMDHLARERVFEELCKLLPLVSAADLLQFTPILTQVLPELAPTVGFCQHNRHHAYDIFTHTAHVTAAVPADLTLRWAALLHDVGKVSTFSLDEAGQGHFLGHAKVSARLADAALLRMKAPTALRQQVVLLIEKHMTLIVPERKTVRRWLSRLGAHTLEQLLALQEADMGSKGTGIPKEMEQFTRIRELIAQIEAENACLTIRDLAVNGHDLMALGISGKEIGQTLQALLDHVLDETLPNEKYALLQAAAKEEPL